jgi:hypothetical protein
LIALLLLFSLCFFLFLFSFFSPDLSLSFLLSSLLSDVRCKEEEESEKAGMREKVRV